MLLLIRYCIIGLLSLMLVLFVPSTSPAQSLDFAEGVVSTTFNQLPPYAEGGEVASVDAETAEQLGYDPGRTWAAGDLPSEVVRLGDIESGLGAEEFTLEQIAEVTGIDLAELTLADLAFLEGISLEEFVKDIPFLADWDIADIPELAEVLSGDGTLGEVIDANPDLAELPVAEVLGELPVSSIPNLGSAELSDFAGIGNQTIANVPGLGDVALGSFPIPVAMPSINVFPRQDIAFESKEYSGGKPTPQPVSGGTNGTEIWLPMACEGGCPHIELADNGWEGANWMTKEHRVRDGHGVLGQIFDEAGAYRIPFGPSFALQVADTAENIGEADWGLAFRVCIKNAFVDLGCTAYFMEVPLGLSTKEGDNILTGIRDGLGGSTQPMEAPPGYENLRPELPPELQGAIEANTPVGGLTPLCGDGPGGVKMEALAEAFHRIESAGAGAYGAVGIFVSLSPGETGRALGKYQYMSYREDVIAKIGSTPAGAALIRLARSGARPTTEQVLSGFPPEDQDSLFTEDQTNNIELLISRGFEGERIIEILGQMHLRGPGVLDNGELDSTRAKDGLGTSVKAYGKRFLDYYKETLAKLPDGDENSRCKSTGTFINPTADGYQSFSRRFSASNVYNPVVRTARPHDGDDLAIPQGSTVVASDGGVVELHQDKCSVGPDCGYGDFLVIVHEGGYETWYAHLSERLVAHGSRVKQGQAIARSGGAMGVKGSGGSTGPHLHFEVRQSGKPIPPETVVDYSRTVRDVARDLSANNISTKVRS